MIHDALNTFRRRLLGTTDVRRPRRALRTGRPQTALERLESRELLSAVTYFQTFEGVDWTSTGAGGVGAWNGGSATLSASNVSGQIVAGYLYWQGIDLVANGGNGVYDNATVSFDGVQVTGASLGTGATGGWGTGGSQAFRADVTDLLRTGLQSYSVSGLAALRGHNCNGVSLIIVYQDGNVANDRDLFVLDGNHVSGGAGSDGNWTAQLDGLNYRHGDVRVQMHVADGQNLSDAAIQVSSSLGGSLTITDRSGQLDGNSVPTMGRSRAINGSLWDINTFDITAAMGSGSGFCCIDLSQGPPSDSLALVVLLFDTSARDLNSPPVASDQTFSGREDVPVTGQLAGVDGEGDPLTWSVVSPPASGHLWLDAATGAFRWTPPANWSGTITFSYRVSDGHFNSNVATVTLVLDPVNDAPFLWAPVLSTHEDQTVSGSVNANDVDGDALAWSVGVGPSHGTLLLNGDGSFVYTPDGDWFGQDSFTLSVSDGTASVTALVSVGVNAVNDPPIVAPLHVDVDEDGSVSGNVLAFDIDDTNLGFSLHGGPGHGTLTLNPDGSFVYAPHSGWSGDDSFTVAVTDGKSDPVIAVVHLHVAAVNDPPVVSPLHVSADEDSPASGNVSASDSDGDPLSWHVVTRPDHGTLVFFADGRYVYTPQGNWHGDDSFTVAVSDGRSNPVTLVVTVSVAEVNDLPAVTPTSSSANEDSSAAGKLVATDIDGDPLSFLLVDGPDHGTLVLGDDGSYVYSPLANWNGSDSFTVQVSDGRGGVVTSVVPVVVAALNDAPTASSSTFSVFANSPNGALVGKVTASDIDGDSLVYAITSGNANGAFAIDAATGQITVANGALLDGKTPQITLTVSVSDGKGGVATATVLVGVQTQPVKFQLNLGNTVNLKGLPWLPVVIYSTDTLDARQIDVRSVTFGRTGDERSFVHFLGNHFHYYLDMNGDGRKDLVMLFDTKRTGLKPGDTSATLKGRLTNGTTFTSTTPVVVTDGTKAKKR